MRFYRRIYLIENGGTTRPPSIKCVFDIIDLPVQITCNVKPNGKFLPALHAIQLCNPTVFSLLFFGYRLGRKSVRVGSTRLDFDKRVNAVFIGDDVRLADVRFVVTLQNTVSALF